MQDRGLFGAFSDIAVSHPELVAVEGAEGALTYAQLRSRAGGVQRRLIALGVRPEERVAMIRSRSPQALAEMLGIMAAGAAYLPIDPSTPAGRVAELCADSKVRFALAADGIEIPAGVTPVPAGVDQEPAGLEVNEGQLAYVIYTSGSTGKPKGVAVEHRNLLAYCRGVAPLLSIQPGERFGCISTLAADLGHTAIFPTLLAGGSVVMISETGARDPATLASELAARQIDLLKIVPSHLRVLLLHPAAAQLLPRRLLVLGGERLDWQLVERLRELAPRLALLNHYGPTETTVGALACPLDALGSKGSSVPVGWPIGATRVLVVAESGDEAKEGELWIGGPQVSRGYLGDAARTAERFCELEGDRYYRTGDLVRRLESGAVEFLGRNDDQVKIRGHRIELGEVEATLREMPGVEAACVQALPGPQGEMVLVAYLCGSFTEQGLSEPLARRLPAQMIPSRFVRLASLPLNANGKLDRLALPKPEWGTEETGLLGLLAEVLGVVRVPAGKSFAELGGDSLGAMRACALAASRLRLGLSFAELMASRDLRRLSAEPLPEAVSGARPLRPSSIQRRLWLLEQSGAGGAGYVLPLAFRLEGVIDVQRLQASLDSLVARHPMLRTGFQELPGGQLELCEVGGCELRVRECIEREVDSALRGLVGQRLDLSGSLFAADLLQVSPTSAVLCLRLHHLIADGWALEQLEQDLEQAWRGSLPGDEQGGYLDWAAAEPERAASAAAQRAPELTGYPEPELPLEGEPGARQRMDLWLEDERWQRLQEVARHASVTPASLLLASFELLVAKLSAQDRFLIASVAANRPPGQETIVGMYANTVLIACEPHQPGTVRDLLRAVQRSALEAYASQEADLALLASTLFPTRDPRRLFPQVVFSYEGLARRPPVLDGLGVERMDLEQEPEDFELGLFCTVIEGRLRLRLRHRHPASAAMLKEWLASLDRLLAQIEGDLELPASELRLAPAPAGTVSTGPGQARDVVGVIVDNCRQHPEVPALVYPNRCLTYGELLQASAALASGLAEAGVGPESLVAVVAPRSPELVTALFACWLRGACYLPLDPAHPRDRLQTLIERAQPALVLVHPGLAESEVLGRAVDLDHLLATPPSPLERVEITPELAAYAIYTSGSTGEPKLVVVPHEGMGPMLESAASSYRGAIGYRIGQLCGPAFDGLAEEVWRGLYTSATVVGAPEDVRADPASLAAWIEEAGLEHCWVPTAVAEPMLELDWEPSKLRSLMTAGERLHRAHGHRHGFSFRNYYGPSEHTVTATQQVVEPGRDQAPPIGVPIPGKRVYLLDRNLQPVPQGALGEIVIGGLGAARGYAGRPAATAERFMPDPWSQRPGSRMYRTGDLGRWNRQGELEFCGRIDDQVQVRGHRVELGEVEAVLRSLPGVLAAAVAADGEAGASTGLLAAVVTDSGLELTSLRTQLRAQLPAVMVPRLFRVSAIPLTPNGKLDRAAMRQEALRHESSVTLPEMEPERTLAAIWIELLGTDEVGPKDDFIELGGHSLLLARLLRLLHERLGVALTFSELMQATTFAAQASLITRQQGGGAPPIDAAEAKRLLERIDELSEEEVERLLGILDRA